MYRYVRVGALLSFLFCQLKAVCQTEAHYWTHQYGSKGLLMNGAVIASPDDETSLFYNPGAMGMDDKLGFAFSFLSPTYSQLTLRNFIGNDNSITDPGFGFAPGFLAVRFKPFKTDDIVAGVTAFKRLKSGIKFKDRVVDRANEQDQLLFRGDLDFSRKVSEEWFGIGMAWNPDDNLGIGASHYFVFHGQSLDFDFKKEIFFSSNLLEPIFSWRSEFGYGVTSYGGSITKLGLAYRTEGWSFGLTYTSPLYAPIYKSAGYHIEDLKVDNALVTTSSVSNRKGVNLNEIKSPQSFGFGVDCQLEDTHISVSAEYFSSIDRYTIFEDIDDTFDGLGEDPYETNISIKSENSKVFNIAIGVQHQMSRAWTWLAGFRTDFDQGNSLLINDETEYLGTTGDIFHLSGGTTYKYGKNVFSMGVDFGYGTNKGGQQLVDLSNIRQDNIFAFSENQNVSSRFTSIMLFFTYDFIFRGFNN